MEEQKLTDPEKLQLFEKVLEVLEVPKGLNYKGTQYRLEGKLNYLIKRDKALEKMQEALKIIQGV